MCTTTKASKISLTSVIRLKNPLVDILDLTLMKIFPTLLSNILRRCINSFKFSGLTNNIFIRF